MRGLFTFLFIIITVAAFSQMNAGPDTIICNGYSTVLQGSGPGAYTYSWSSNPWDPSMSDSTILQPTVTPFQTTVYTLEGRSVFPGNLITNGDFEDGNTGFTSSYTYAPGPNGLWPEATYAITTDASQNHNNFTCNHDHTTGNGNFMAINGAGTPNVEVWSTTVTGISPNTEYEFSAWVHSLVSSSPAILQFRINGELLGDPFQASPLICQWNKFFEQWNSGNNTTATISIVNQNTATSGNDFSLDDINFSRVFYYYDSCEVTIQSSPTTTFYIIPNDEICALDTAIIGYEGNAQPAPHATYHWNLDGGTLISTDPYQNLEVSWTEPGTKTVSLWVHQLCPSNDTTYVTIEVLPTPTAELTADEVSLPIGGTTTLHGEMDGGTGTLDFLWTPESMVQDPGNVDTETVPLDQDQFYRFYTEDDNGCHADDTITIYIGGAPLGIASYTANPETICFGLDSQLDIIVQGGSGGYTMTWTSDPPGFNYSGPETSQTVQPDTTTTYFVEVTDGFTTLPQVSVTVTVLPQINVLFHPEDTLVEVGQSAVYTVEAENITSYQWQESTDNGMIWTNLNDNTTYSGVTTNTLTISNATESMDDNLYRCWFEGDCDPANTDGGRLDIVLSPDFIVSLTDQQVCEQDTFQIPCTITNFETIDSLRLTLGYDTAFLRFNGIEDKHSALATLNYVMVSDTVTITWNNIAGATIGTGDLFSLSFIAKTAGTTDINWDDNSFVRNSFGFYPKLVMGPSSVEILAMPESPDLLTAFPDSINILDEITIQLDGVGGSGIEMNWYMNGCADSLIGSGTSIQILRPVVNTTYYANWTNQCGISECKDVSVVIFSEDLSLGIASAFTPNNDGLNDEFGVVTPNELPFFELQIFNRWGQLVYKTENQHAPWTGKVNGKMAEAGVYIWKLKYQYRLEGQESDLHEGTGTVTLIR